MAKTIKCEMCGKEVKNGWFDCESKVMLFGTRSVDMCEDCYAKYSDLSKEVKKTIEAKLENRKKMAGKAPQEELIQLIKETRERLDRNINFFESGNIDTHYINCFNVNDKGFFTAREAKMGFAYKDVDFTLMEKTAVKSKDVGDLIYSKDDITATKIYYRRDKTPHCVKDRKNFFAHSYEIMLNDCGTLSSKPCFVRASVVSISNSIFTANKVLDALFENGLQSFLNAIGSTASFERVKKF